MHISETERGIIVNALYTAADRYRECAAAIATSDLPQEAKDRLVATFAKQTAECSKLLERIEQ